MTSRHLKVIAALLLFALLALVFRPIPVPDNAAECATVRGTVTEIYEGGVKDIGFKLREHPDRIFYINRGLERGLELATLQQNLLNNEVTLLYPRYWTPLDPFNSTRHVSKVECGGNTIFSEIR